MTTNTLRQLRTPATFSSRPSTPAPTKSNANHEPRRSFILVFLKALSAFAA